MHATQHRRTGSETKAEILETALDLFTRQGFEGTSIRDIADALGMTKSSLYYHFTNKEAILSALVSDRHDEIEMLLDWLDGQPAGPGLLRRAALHWIDSAGDERLRGMRFARSNHPVMQRLAEEGADRGVWFDEVVDRVLPPHASTLDRIRARMAFDTIAAAIAAAQGTAATDRDILAAARAATLSLT